MNYNITITIPVSQLNGQEEAESMAESIIEHLSETFNDNDTLDTSNCYFKVKLIQS